MKRGPKNKGRVASGYRLTPATLEAVSQYAASTGQSKNDAAEQLLSRALSQEITMNTYIITEKENFKSARKGTTITAANLGDAKRKAAAMQAFQGTVLTIETEQGLLVGYKESGKWVSPQTIDDIHAALHRRQEELREMDDDEP